MLLVVLKRKLAVIFQIVLKKQASCQTRYSSIFLISQKVQLSTLHQVKKGFLFQSYKALQAGLLYL